MIRLSCTEAEIAELEYQRYHHPHPRVQQRMEIVSLRAKGVSQTEIARLVGLCDNSVRRYLRAYQTGGIEAVKELTYARPQSELAVHQQSLEVYFRAHPPHSIAHAISTIEHLTGLRRSPTQVRLFLKRMGFKPLKTAAIPAKCDPARQEAFKKPNWSPG